MKPSSSTDGFIQAIPKLENQFLEDAALRRVFELLIPSQAQAALTTSLTTFGSTVLNPSIFRLIENAEKHEPYIRTFDSFGRRIDELVTSEGWRGLQEIGIREGIMATGYERLGQSGAVVAPDPASAGESDLQCARVYQFIKYLLWTGSCANVTCPSAMQDGAARLLFTHLNRDAQSGHKLLSNTERLVLSTAFRHLTSRDPAICWTSGQWMTERSGGSDIRGTETLATWAGDSKSEVDGTDTDGNPLGPWRIDGFKWFSSATDSHMTLLLAKEPSNGAISLFFAPTRRINARGQVELNGVQLQRLKSKLGTHPLPTAELVLNNMRAWRIGASGAGTKEISTILNITRMHTAMSALGYWGRGLAIGRAFARVRKAAGGRSLRDVEAHVRTMAGNEVNYRARMMFCFFTVSLLGRVENPTCSPSLKNGSTNPILEPSLEIATNLLRLLTPLAKAVSTKDSVVALQECMESLGGVGYLENEDQEINIARLFRDANVGPIWEGTTDVLGTDLVRVVKPAPKKTTKEGKTDLRVREAIGRWMEGESIGTETKLLLEQIRSSSPEQLRYDARGLMWRITWLVGAAVLVEDARRDGNQVAWEIARRWVYERHPEGATKGISSSGSQSWSERANWDRQIVFDAGDRMGSDAEKQKARL
ncbi:acyl-CoA dehydrogenase/oxidase C-terminal [Rhizodiscina lignyota]|uniref:Acyl-CoA dehydrogenase/oxidase C-terminal n=1 Tax=Rhizodiscina lignyota TaxID=1504668 RepID=A0A9P4I8N2_9PEZI|nr:acyl-CoA dehydrogenase/oxidase C-terminal [Rhizodiscina lignyota]